MLPRIALKLSARLTSGDTLLKLLCLAVALCIWGVSHIRGLATREVVLPMQFSQLPSGFRAVATPAADLHIVLSGPLPQMQSFIRDTPRVVLSLKDAAAPGVTIFNHLDAHLGLPDKVRAIRISPASIRVELVSSGAADQKSK